MNIVHINMTGGFFKKIILQVTLVMILCTCGYKVPIGFPTPNNYQNRAPDGPPAFQYGWVQGCDTGISGWTSQFYNGTGLSKFQKDFTFADANPDYELAWQTAFWYCMRNAERLDGRRRDKYRGL